VNGSYGFVRGRGLQDALNEAIRRRTTSEWVLKTDIESFFDQIDRADLKRRLQKHFGRHSVVPLLCSVVDCEIKVTCPQDKCRLDQLNIKRRRGLRQGMPLSPMLSNFVLSDFDRSVAHNGYNLIRYADDLVLFGNTRNDVEAGYGFLAKELAKVGHSIPAPGPDSKTQFIPPKKPAEFLGIEIVHKETENRYICRIPKSVREKIIEEIAENNTVMRALNENLNFSDLCRRVSGLPTSYRSAYEHADNWKNFQSDVNIACKCALRRIFSDIFGVEALSHLTNDIQSFLGINSLLDD
jgi:hypothetical protein